MGRDHESMTFTQTHTHTQIHTCSNGAIHGSLTSACHPLAGPLLSCIVWLSMCVCVCVCVFVTPSVGHAGSQLQQQSVISISTGLLFSGSSRPCPAAERSHQCAGTGSDTLWAPPGSSLQRTSARYTTMQLHYYPSAHTELQIPDHYDPFFFVCFKWNWS